MRQLIRTTLTATGFHLEETSSAQSALEMTRKGGFDLVLLDLNVPDKGGADACRRLRAQSPALGIIVVGANGHGKNPEEDEWRMIEAGADDCVTAPFRFREIVARMGAVLRRPAPVKSKPRLFLRAGDMELDLKQRSLRRGGEEIRLSPREYDLLTVLMANTGTALTHTKLARTAWGDGPHHNREYLRTYIQSLRQKLEADPARPEYILTQPWVGYRFRDPLQNKTN